MSSAVSTTSAGGRQRLLDARRALYRAAIVEAAERVFADHGYDPAKVQVIAKEAGVSLATVYGIFPSKWEIFRAVQHDRLVALMQRVGTLVMNATDVFDRLRFGIEGYLRFHMDHPEFLRIQLREQVPWGTLDELHTPEQTHAWEQGLQMLTAAFREGIAQGLLVDDDPECSARMATAMGQVRLVLWVNRGMQDAPEEVGRAASLQFVRTFVQSRRVAELSERVRSTPLPTWSA
jgi:AcrR family transcriptional regulator